MRILLLEDDPDLAGAVLEHIAEQGHAVDGFTTLVQARSVLASTDYDLLLLDLMLPDGRGIDLLRELRARGSTLAVIILTALDQISDRIEGLNAGADDYLVKPFDLNELSARIAAVQRRLQGRGPVAKRYGPLSIDVDNKLLVRDTAPVSLSGREWAVLERLLRHPNATVSKAQIEDALYAFGTEVESNAVEVYISRLRKKLGREAIATERGLGYRFDLVST